jgi:glucose-6-phosphate dehydrogenase assembly protein OpcA
VAALVSEDVWAERDTTPDAIDAALREMLRARHAANQGLAPARVLNLVVVVDADWKGEIANRLAGVGRYHASRTVLCAVADGRSTLDARAVMAYDDAGDGPGVMHEQVVLDIGPGHLRAIDTVIDPLIVSELPTLVWCPHGHWDAVSSLLGMTDVVLLDSDDDAEAADGLARAEELLRSVYVVDLAWLRTTPWRERVAASFDPPGRSSKLARISGLSVRHRQSSTASALLLAGWLSSRLRWEVSSLAATDGSGWSGTLGHVTVALDSADQDAPGLAGVTVACERGFSLSLDRGRGGLTANQRSADGDQRSWRVLGASRGEGGILGEGVRQALLRDPTYGPALAAARGLCPA